MNISGKEISYKIKLVVNLGSELKGILNVHFQMKTNLPTQRSVSEDNEMFCA
jgi:hypothetical protein